MPQCYAISMGRARSNDERSSRLICSQVKPPSLSHRGAGLLAARADGHEGDEPERLRRQPHEGQGASSISACQCCREVESPCAVIVSQRANCAMPMTLRRLIARFARRESIARCGACRILEDEQASSHRTAGSPRAGGSVRAGRPRVVRRGYPRCTSQNAAFRSRSRTTRHGCALNADGTRWTAAWRSATKSGGNAPGAVAVSSGVRRRGA